MKNPWGSGEVQAYLGEKVVKEKEYLSAIVSADLENYSGMLPKREIFEWRLKDFADMKEDERLSCCRCGVEV